MSEKLISDNGEGVLAFITNNSFLKGVTHRKMREHLMGTFDEIKIVDLHGDSNQREVSPDGSVDENVFDIMQGVSINIFIKKPKPISTSVHHIDLFGKRSEKNTALLSYKHIQSTLAELKPSKPYFFFRPENRENLESYEAGYSITDVLPIYSTGIQTKRDALCLQPSLKKLQATLDDLITMETEDFRKAYSLVSDNRDWSIEWARQDIEKTLL